MTKVEAIKKVMEGQGGTAKTYKVTFTGVINVKVKDLDELLEKATHAVYTDQKAAFLDTLEMEDYEEVTH